MLEEVFAGIFMSHSARWHGQDLQALATRFCSEWCSVAQAYYKLNYVDRQIASPEQRICEDLPAFCHGVADLSLEWVQAAVDAAFYAFMLRRYSKTNAWTAAIFAYVLGCGAFTSAFAPNFGKLFKRQSENEGASSLSCALLPSLPVSPSWSSARPMLSRWNVGSNVAKQLSPLGQVSAQSAISGKLYTWQSGEPWVSCRPFSFAR